MLVELDVHAHDHPPSDPRFEIWAANNQTVTMTVPDGKSSEIAIVAHDFVAVQSAWADKGEFFDRDGNWAFFEARITPLH